MTLTLVLNADYTPLRIISWKKAFTLVYKDTVKGIDFYDRKIRDSKGRYYPIPAVVVLKKFVRPSKRVRFNKQNVYLRDNFQCQYCGKVLPPHQLTYDHVIPKSKFRNKSKQTCWTNIVTCCGECNRKKANHYCKDVNMFPIRSPYEPSVHEIVSKTFQTTKNTPHEWEVWLQSMRAK